MLRWDFGSVLKEIRQSKGISQAQLGGEELSRFAISKIEANQSIPTAEHMIYILHQLDMSMDEFLYICNEYQPSRRQKLLNQFYALGSFTSASNFEELIDSCRDYLKNQEDVPISHLLEMLEISLVIQKNGVEPRSEQLSALTQKMWSRLSQYDTWYWTDFQQIAVILYFFPADAVSDLTEQILKSLVKYQHYRPTKPVEFGLLINLSTIYLYQQENRTICQALTLSALEIAQKLKRYDYLGFAQVRLGICQKDEALIEKGMALLQLTDETSLVESLTEEIKKYRS